MKRFDGFQLKLFMMILMVFDHLSGIHGLLSAEQVAAFHAITRCVSVWFAYMTVEGFIHTRNKKKYNLRLFAWAMVMYIGNALINSFAGYNAVSNNIFMTLAMGVLIMNISEYPLVINGKCGKIAEIMTKTALIICAMGVSFAFCEGGMVVVPFTMITYFFRQKEKVRNILYVIMSIILLIPSISIFGMYGDLKTEMDMFLYNSDWLFITVLPFIYMYNGERGRNTKFSKYLFYVFYPLHLWIIAILNYILK